MNCDNCKYYKWYYNHCRKWDCEIDTREVHNCYEPYDTPIRDNMINYSKQKLSLMRQITYEETS